MLIQLRKRMGREEGFTLIELLVVMLILGILAAIAIPTFFNQREKAQDSDAKAMARTAQTAIETYATDNGGSYSGATPAILDGLEPTIDALATDVNQVTVPTATSNSYTVTAKSAANGGARTFTIGRTAGGAFTFTCTPVGGGCPSGGWGG